MRMDTQVLAETYRDRLFAAAFQVCGNAADAEDAAQEALLCYHASEKQFESEQHIRAWLLRVAINRAKDIAGSFWHRNTVSWEEYMEELDFAAPEDSRLFQAVMELPRKYRVPIHLYYYEDYSVEEIAKLLGSRPGTVKSQLSRGRKLLKSMLTEEWDDDE